MWLKVRHETTKCFDYKFPQLNTHLANLLGAGGVNGHLSLNCPSHFPFNRREKILRSQHLESCHMMNTIPYSGKLVIFTVLWLYAKVFSAKFWAWHPLAWQKRAIWESFLRENRVLTNLQKFPPSKVSCYTVFDWNHLSSRRKAAPINMCVQFSATAILSQQKKNKMWGRCFKA